MSLIHNQIIPTISPSASMSQNIAPQGASAAMVPVATGDKTSLKPRSHRTRAPKACLSCRTRKVRCDVSRRGPPCMNCYLDNEACVVTARASRLRLRCDNEINVETSCPPYEHANNDGKQSSEEVVGEGSKSTYAPLPSPSTEKDSPVNQTTQLHHEKTPPFELASFASSSDREIPKIHQLHATTPTRELPGSKDLSHFATVSFPSRDCHPLPLSAACSPDSHRRDTPADVLYSYYPFLTIGNLSNLPSQDVNFLETQRCLRVPTRALLDALLQQYFLHVHPLLPLLNEGDFWDVYCLGARNFSHKDGIPLLLLHSILFAACSFASNATIKALGYSDIRAARADFYRRAKLLYNMESESSPLILSQSALLLSYWCPSSSRKTNTIWLGLAIQHAKHVEAHQYAAMPTFPASTHLKQHQKQKVLKKLWWCCVIRDRTVGLLMRRSIHITRSHYDFNPTSMLHLKDMEDEFTTSKVYNAEVKRSLAEVLIQLVELCVILTDILTTICPLDHNPVWVQDIQNRDAHKLQACQLELRRWYKVATLQSSVFGSWPPQPNLREESSRTLGHDSVILYSNLVFMYYHSTRATICHYEILQLALKQAQSPSERDLRIPSNLVESRNELQDAASGVTDCLQELVHRNLARWLPISAVVCTALPLVLNILDIKLSALSSSEGQNSATMTQKHLNILIEAMKIYQLRYDGVDWVSEIIRHIVNLSQLDHTQIQDKVGPTVSSWADILSIQPTVYLRLAFALDVSLSKGRLPEEGDFPLSLRGLFTKDSNPLKALIEASRHDPRLSPGSRNGRSSAPVLATHPHSCCCRGANATHRDSHAAGHDEPMTGTMDHPVQTHIRMDQLMTNSSGTLPDDLLAWAADLEGFFGSGVENGTPSSSSDSVAEQLHNPALDASFDENEGAWDGMSGVEDIEDKETAHALLEALDGKSELIA